MIWGLGLFRVCQFPEPSEMFENISQQVLREQKPLSSSHEGMGHNDSQISAF